MVERFQAKSRQNAEGSRVLRIFDPTDKPFGDLSNNARTPITIDKERWNTVTNYIYGMALRVSAYQSSLQVIDVKDALTAFRTLHQMSIDNTVSWAAEEALNIKFRNPALSKLLLSTGNAQIKYMSPNALLGVGADKKGENRYGRLLMQMRNRFQNISNQEKETKESEREHQIIYDAYMAGQALRQAVRNGDANLAEYRNMTPTEILDQYRVIYSIKEAAKRAGDSESKYDGLKVEEMAKKYRAYLLSIRETSNLDDIKSVSAIIANFKKKGSDDLPSVSKEAVISLYNRGTLDSAIKYALAGHPSALLASARRAELASLRMRQLRKIKSVAFNLYLEDILELDYADKVSPEQYGTAISQAKEGYSQTAIMKAEDDLYNLFVTDMLPKELSARITTAISHITVPTPDEVREAQATPSHPELSEDNGPYPSTNEVNLQATLAAYLGKYDPISIDTIPTLIEQFELDCVPEDDTVAYNKRRASLFTYLEDKYKQVLEPVLERVQPPVSESNTASMKSTDIVQVYPKPIKNEFDAFQDFSPLSFTGMLNIDGYNFPSVTHYIFFRLLANLSARFLVLRDIAGQEIRMKDISTKRRAYLLLLVDPIDAIANTSQDFRSPEAIMKDYDERSNESYLTTIKENAVRAMSVKFESRVFQDLLLDTGDATLVYTDRDSSILGIGVDGKGQNFVGKFLMDLRSKILRERGMYDVTLLTEEDVAKVMFSDEGLRNWLITRVSDTCSAVNTVRNYMYQKHGVDQKLTAPFVRHVLNDIYYPCAHLYSMSEQITMKAPGYFKGILKQRPGWKEAPNDVVNVVWKRIAVMIYLIVTETESKSAASVLTLLKKASGIISQEALCQPVCEGLPKSLNCVVSAIINIMKGLGELNVRLGYEWVADEVDVKTATELILDRSVIIDQIDTDESSPMSESVAKNLDDEFGESVCYPEELAKVVIARAEFVDSFNIPENIKRGRVNFFASMKDKQ